MEEVHFLWVTLQIESSGIKLYCHVGECLVNPSHAIVHMITMCWFLL